MCPPLRPALLAAAALPALLFADEGLWLFNQFPKARVSQKYGFQVTDAFLDHLRLSSVRFSSGGSGSFISPTGLLFTNHHVGSDCIQKLSSAENDFLGKGFYAAEESQEKACPDLEINLLLRIEDVTGRVDEGIPPEAAAAERNRLRKAAMTRIENQCNRETGNRCDVVTLFSGGQYHLYQYRKYTDVRLVFAPEADIAAFGGDPDNFTFPRYCLDFALFRAYENGKPAKVEHYFRWSRKGVREGDLVFVPGNPGTTGRLATMAQLEFYRDTSYPFVHAYLGSLIQTLQAYSARSEEHARAARDTLAGPLNSFKAYTGFLNGLRDEGLMRAKAAEERRLREAVAAKPELQAKFGSTWDDLAAAYREFPQFYKRYWLLELNPAPGSDLFRIARLVLRYAEEKAKPNEQRIRTFVDAALPSVEQEMYSPAPITDSLEVEVLAGYLRALTAEIGTEEPAVAAALGGKSPLEAAREYVSTSNLKGVDVRKRLASSPGEVRSSQDGMIRLARLLDQPARRVRRLFEDRIEAANQTGAARIAQARFQIFGASEYPDATFTLRLAYGAVKGYRDASGRQVPFRTVVRGLYQRATGKHPFKLPESWIVAKPRLNPGTPFNFVGTADTHGGNSGSPTLNTKAEIVGILFDGNLESLPNRFQYTEERARSVHVSGEVLIEALRKVYRADRILKEIGR